MADVIVVGVDGSEGARRALDWAIDEARLRGAVVRAVMAWSYIDQPAERFDPDYGGDDAQEELDALVDAAIGAGATSGAVEPAAVSVERIVVNDLPARALLDAAADADLIVVGARGIGGFKGLLLGSVSQQVVQHAPCPVVVVPGAEREGSNA